MQSLVINKTKSEVRIRDFYHIGDGGGWYGSVVYRLKPDGYKSISPSYFERLSKTMFAPLEIRVFTGCGKEFVGFSPLELDLCDGIVIKIDDNGRLAPQFVPKDREYSHEWLRYWIPYLGIKERIQHILSAPSNKAAFKPDSGRVSEGDKKEDEQGGHYCITLAGISNWLPFLGTASGSPSKHARSLSSLRLCRSSDLGSSSV